MSSYLILIISNELCTTNKRFEEFKLFPQNKNWKESSRTTQSEICNKFDSLGQIHHTRLQEKYIILNFFNLIFPKMGISGLKKKKS